MASEIVIEFVIDVPLESWIESARGGSSEALGWAFEASRPHLLRVANKRLGADLRVKEDVTDVVQGTFLEAFRDFGRFDGQTSRAWYTWLEQILERNVYNIARHYRKAAKRDMDREVPLDLAQARGGIDGGLLDDTTSPSGHAMRKERMEAMQRAIARLPEAYRQVLEWRLEYEFSYQEMGWRLGCSGVTARNRWKDALNLLWSELGVSSLAR